MAVAIVRTFRPKASATPTHPIPSPGHAAASTALPHPPRPGQNVPKNSAAAFLIMLPLLVSDSFSPSTGSGQIAGAVPALLGGAGDGRAAEGAVLGGGCLGLLAAADGLDPEGDGEGDEVQDRVDEEAVVQRGGPRRLRGGQGLVGLPGQVHEEVGEIDASE